MDKIDALFMVRATATLYGFGPDGQKELIKARRTARRMGISLKEINNATAQGWDDNGRPWRSNSTFSPEVAKSETNSDSM